MGKKVTAVSAVPVATRVNKDNNDEDEEATEHDEMELLQVDVGDMVKLKQILDETVANTILEHLEEEYRLDNIKLSIMTMACLFAVVAQFSPIPFPDSRPLLGVCCCAYFLLSGILQLIASFIDQDAILLTKPKNKKASKNNVDMTKYGLRVRSTLPRFSEWYTVILEFQGYPNKTSPKVEQRWSVGQFFDVEGMFDEVGLMQAVEGVYKKFEASKYDDAKDATEKKNQ